jgi:hypothetical protein
MAVGTFLHFHYFWGLHRRLARFSSEGKVIAILMFVAGLGFLFYYQLMMG